MWEQARSCQVLNLSGDEIHGDEIKTSKTMATTVDRLRPPSLRAQQTVLFPSPPISIEVHAYYLCAYQEILNEMNNMPVADRDLDLENDLFGAIKQLLAWKPPPMGKRDRSRYSMSCFECCLLQTTNNTDQMLFEKQAIL